MHSFVCLLKILHFVSLSLHLLLKVSYIPTEVFTTPDSDVTLYAVFHNRSWSASKAVWLLNGQVKIPESQYRVINERVSAVTLQATGPGFDSLMCCHPWGERFKCTIAYAKMYTEGESCFMKNKQLFES